MLIANIFEELAIDQHKTDIRKIRCNVDIFLKIQWQQVLLLWLHPVAY